MRVLVAVFCTLLLVGCGGSNPVEKSFGGLTEGDMQAVQSVSTSLQSLSTDIATIQAELTAENITGARSAIDATAPKLDQADDKTLDLDNSDLRTTLQDYVTTTRELVGSFDRWVAYFEDDSTLRDEALENDLLGDIDAAATDMRKADQAFLNRLLDNASPEQRKEIRARYRDALERLTDSAGGS
ncbi:hypothetical protein OJ997_29440 [Solirubrobacter phytolaccae]|uniref:Uncharacterized protein n=2 Tax=Solirubrobacter phytolaccae TaxID=1404360 RepID=A0A9X3NFQ5_9ACTN|nr:hypothetical protein [Solirubrobacter phytolaccae]